MWFFFSKFILLIKVQTLSHKLFVRQTSNHHHCNWHAQKLYAGNFKQIWTVLPGQKQLDLCIFKEQIWLPNRKYNGKNKLYFDQEEMLQMAWYFSYIGFWMCQIPMAQVLRLYIQMFLSYGLYVCIFLETTHHRDYFQNILQIYSKYYTQRK